VNTLGNGLFALLRHPEEWARLVAGAVSPAAAVEELIRWNPPLQLFERWVLENGVEIAGEPVPRGAKVALLFGSANRDPRVFPIRSVSTSAARTLPSTSASAAASTSASVRRSRGSRSQRACARWWSGRRDSPWPRSQGATAPS